MRKLGPAAEARPEVRIDRSDVGRRVSVRSLDAVRDTATGRPVFRDVIGLLTSWDDHGLTVVRRDNTVAEIADAALVAGKVVPLFPARRAPLPEATPVELQRIAARGWPAVEQEPLGEWTLRASAGFTRRANSVQALGDPALPLPQALDRVRQWYADRGLPALIEVTSPGSPEGLVAELERLGAGLDQTLVRTAPIAPLTKVGRAPERVRLSRTAGPRWLSAYRRAGGDPALDAAAAQVLHGGPSVWFATVPAADPDDTPLAIGRGVIDGAWACFAAIEVQPAARRQGLAGSVMAVLAARAAEEGATGGYLQVEAENAAAIALYDGLGFTTSHTYHYARLPRS
ncbi:GNAT superfamily N-acetyltransferase [Kitasatospora sp. MAA4]|uniref:GNAT family N-acetyltransferase n=1 Tax=Kitasatospora sp. MAA4 TaxID=3035093 RepID=UPI002475541F|nr:GNAT family N-acetyltransferase [Kitasatospora sp. MAA4]MDH6135068.1 GNAT superfamily N-acetyltransferase [Kitasatospora sp. MAA4]